MSIWDESFPNDEFFDELDFTPNAKHKRYQFPHTRRQQLQQQHQQLLHGEIKTIAKTIATTTAKVLTKTTNSAKLSSSSSSTSSSTSSLHDRNNVTSEDVNNNKTIKETTASEPTTGSSGNDAKKPHFLSQRQNKAVSYQDIHSEYTKRRYKHVESKVGQYIAIMKAEDEKRRNSRKFQRHRSMPETLSDQNVNAAAEIAARHSEICSSVAELHTLDEFAETNNAEADSSESTTGTSTSSRARHETSDEVGPSYAQLIDEKERIQSHRDYLELRLDEKINENMLLKRNVDFMRIELSNCKDKLQKQMSLGANYSASSCTFRRQSTFAYLHGIEAKSTKATQTEFITPIAPPPAHVGILTRDLFTVTPGTPDANNNIFESGDAHTSTVGNGGDIALADCKSKSSKTVATIQPLSLNFSNLVENDSAELQTNDSGGLMTKPVAAGNSSNSHSQTHNSNTSHPSSADSAIEVETASPKKTAAIMPHNPAASIASSFTHERQERNDEEFTRCERTSGTNAAVELLKSSSPDNCDESNRSCAISSTGLVGSASGTGNKLMKKHKSLRRRWLRLFAPCTSCKDHNQTFDGAHTSSSNALEQTYTQIPLLEKSFSNHCRNLR